MISLTIDGIQTQVAVGTNLVEAAKKVGIEIPTYCYHPALSVVGQCRICFVEVEGMPRLVTACSTIAQDGMKVHTDNERVREARAAVMEFLLANHPLDCPVCDQAGECYLQDYSVEHGLDSTHMADTRRTFPGFERRLIGPHVVQNQNRCIHCTRCVRFTREISETHDLTMKSRGNHAYIDTFDGSPFDNPWSACAADVCPVGALTVKDFRFRARVWDLETTDSVCPGCSIGCNMRIDHYKGVVHRFVPRFNSEINGWWMCDYGRFLAESLNQRDADNPQIRKDDALADCSWADAVGRFAEILRGAETPLVIASANLTNEGLFLVKKVLVDHLGLEVVVPFNIGPERKVKNGRREWVHSQDGHPNSCGARLMGLRLVDETQLRDAVTATQGPVVVLDNRAHPWLVSAEAATAVKGRTVAAVARQHTGVSRSASLLLPQASWVETEGSITSSTGRVQLIRRGLFPRGQAKPVWELLRLLAAHIELEVPGSVSPRSIFDELVGEVAAYAGMTYRRLSVEPGVPVLEEVPDVG